MKKLIVVLFSLWITQILFAETIVNFSSDSHRKGITVSVGLDYALLALQIGYVHSFNISKIGRSLILDTGFTFPLTKPDLRDFKIHSGVSINTVKVKKFQIPVSFKFILRGNANKAYNAIGFGSVLMISPGLYTDKITIASEIFWDSEWATYITFSDYYQFIYSDGKEGWYAGSSNIFRFGARIGGLIKKRVEIYVKAGYELQGKYNLKVPPVYAVLGSSIRF